MKLADLQMLFVDCQTTGIRPPRAHLLEVAWGVARPGGEVEVHSRLVRLPEGESIPRLVAEMTGLTAEHMREAVAREEVAEALRACPAPLALIHYAQFEKPFLADLLGEVPFEIFCSHQLTKRLFPKLPSRNIRATAGFFGPPITGLNRAATFVRATAQIWAGLRAELLVRGIDDLAALRELLAAAPTRTKTKAATGYEYRLEKMKRLELPDSPGVYRMLGQNGEVLYVGKATSLRARVNSYFRGKKGRDARKLEMIAQVWDLDVTDCGSPLEAALLESDEIKRLDPPYNVMLRTGRRQLVFYDEAFGDRSTEQSATHPRGPFRNHNWIEHLRALTRSLESGRWEPIFFDEIPTEDVIGGFELFCERLNLEPSRLTTVRAQLALALRLYRTHADPDRDATEESEDEVAAEDDGPPVLTVEDVADKFGRLFIRAGRELCRSRKMTKLLDARVEIAGRRLTFRRGRLLRDAAAPEEFVSREMPWRGLDVDAFDRMSILLTELNKRAAAGEAGHF